MSKIRGLEELGLGGEDVGEEVVGEAGGSDAEILVVEPCVAEHLLDDGVVLDGVLGRGDASGSLEADHSACLVEVFLNALTHHVGRLKRCAWVFLAGGGLEEVGTAVERQDGGRADVFGRLQRATLEDDLQACAAAGVLYLLHLVAQLLIVAVKKQAKVHHDVYLVGTRAYGQGSLGNLDLGECL